MESPLTPLERACAFLDAHRMAWSLDCSEAGLVVFRVGPQWDHAPTLAEAIIAAARALGWDPGQ